MAYVLQGVIASARVLMPCRGYVHGVVAELNQGLCLAPMTRELFDEVKHGDKVHRGFAACRFFPPGFEATLAAWSAVGPVAYVEAEYFAGDGSQFAVVWHDGALTLGPLYRGEDDPPPDRGCSPISQALRRLGAVAGERFDEFDAVGLGLHRDVDGWLRGTQQ